MTYKCDRFSLVENEFKITLYFDCDSKESKIYKSIFDKLIEAKIKFDIILTSFDKTNTKICIYPKTIPEVIFVDEKIIKNIEQKLRIMNTRIYTGFNDKNGREIFVGDEVFINNENYSRLVFYTGNDFILFYENTWIYLDKKIASEITSRRNMW